MHGNKNGKLCLVNKKKYGDTHREDAGKADSKNDGDSLHVDMYITCISISGIANGGLLSL